MKDINDKVKQWRGQNAGTSESNADSDIKQPKVAEDIPEPTDVEGDITDSDFEGDSGEES